MPFIAMLIAFLCLAGCTSPPVVSDIGSADSASARHRQALIDAEVIMQGMNQARSQSQAVAKQAP